MHCPFCGHVETKVNDSRLASEGRQIRRRRECLSCGERFTTFETAELVMPVVVKGDRTREDFDEARSSTLGSATPRVAKIEHQPSRCRRQIAASTRGCEGVDGSPIRASGRMRGRCPGTLSDGQSGSGRSLRLACIRCRECTGGTRVWLLVRSVSPRSSPFPRRSIRSEEQKAGQSCSR